ncbi:MAG TPA: hypothetical protein VK856_14295 [Anaerolineaceae bacterium]|nr:hypothetical protein [Anaerolineaceae bacterium]
MENTKRFLATTGNVLNCVEMLNGDWRNRTILENHRINALIQDPENSRRVYAATQKDGVLVSHDSGDHWENIGLNGIPIKSLAINPMDPKTIYAGCKPVSLYVSKNGGKSWEELDGIRKARQWWWFSPAEPPEWAPYVQALTISPSNPKVILAGIELGGVLRSEDGGVTWSNHLRGADRDCHSLKFHPTDADWVYQGGGGGAAVSQDGGITWKKPKNGIGSKYGWMIAADAQRPEVWYFSASDFPKLWLGEFEPPAHRDGKAKAHIYRKVGGAAWEQLSGGLPDPLDYMAYALIPDPTLSGHLYAGLSNGDVWHTKDFGDIWERLPFNLGGIHNSMIMI